VSLCIAVLTGRRPQLLAQTLDSFTRHHRRIWDGAFRTVLHNTGDPETAEILDRYRWDHRRTTGRLLPIGEASQLLGQQVRDLEPDYVMRLEDDFLAHPADWWGTATGLLGQVDLVRLQLAAEPTKGRCGVCQTKVTWTRVAGGRIAVDAHYTHRPTLMRFDVFDSLFPYRNERHAMLKFHGRKSAQLVPGVFSHLAPGRPLSLRKNGGHT